MMLEPERQSLPGGCSEGSLAAGFSRSIRSRTSLSRSLTVLVLTPLSFASSTCVSHSWCWAPAQLLQ